MSVIKQLIPEWETLLTEEEVNLLEKNLNNCPTECEFTIRELFERNIDNATTDKKMLTWMVDSI